MRNDSTEYLAFVSVFFTVCGKNCIFGDKIVGKMMMTDVKKVIVAYLQTHKRLVVPQLGAFIVKEPDRRILFSELFKRDDGVLRGLLREQGFGEIEAAGAIDRLVFDLRHAAQNGAGYLVPGLGIFTAAPNGALSFACDPQAGMPVPASEPQMPPAEGAEPPQNSAPASAEAADPHGEAAGQHGGAAVQPDEAGSKDAGPSESGRRSYFTPDPCVKGLTYGRPVKTTDPYTFVGHKPAKRVDKFMIVAIVAALLALGVIAYVYVRDMQAKRDAAAFMEEVSDIVSGVPAADAPVEE